MSNIIVMAFSPRNIIGCFLKKKAYKAGVTGTPGTPSPLATPLYGAKVWDARQEEVRMRRDWDETGCSTHVTQPLLVATTNYAFAFSGITRS